jgi:hypothetical protein
MAGTVCWWGSIILAGDDILRTHLIGPLPTVPASVAEEIMKRAMLLVFATVATAGTLRAADDPKAVP